ncbi:MAG TPA: prenyltransferase [Halanaerobiales bacterium]|nr:prenyltransferase [Halanaerobiales bacterium]
MKSAWGCPGDWLELMRPFSWTASIIPVIMAGIVVNRTINMNLYKFLLILMGVLMVHIAGNIVNEFYDSKNGLDTLESERCSKVLLEKRINPVFALKTAKTLFVLYLMGILLYAWFTGLWHIIILAFIGVGSSFYYTAPPLAFKYRGLGVLSIFTTFGILLPQSVYCAFTGIFSPYLFWISLPLAFLVSAILLGNQLRDIDYDCQIVTLISYIGRDYGIYIYTGVICVVYLLPLVYMITGFLNSAWLIFMSLPVAIYLVFISLVKGIKRGQYDQLNKLDVKTAGLHLVYGILWNLALCC